MGQKEQDLVRQEDTCLNTTIRNIYTLNDMKTFTTRLLTSSLVLFFTLIGSASYAQATFTNATFFDTDGDGNVDEVVVTMSGAITDPSIVLGDFDIGGAAPTGILTGGSSVNSLDPDGSNDAVFTFSVNATNITGTATTTVAYTQGSLTNGVLTLSNGAISAVDAANPVLLAASSTPLDGTADVAINTDVVLTFSENVQAGTGDGDVTLVDVTNGTDTRTITLPDGQLVFSTNTLTIN
ncbi:MAG: Ig-like domain-containing protein, partial [Cytophagales bacterium]|nr:Ig-like domain-containing protein [Cytophagales bacterium]